MKSPSSPRRPKLWPLLILLLLAPPAWAIDDGDFADMREDLLGPTLAIHLYLDFAASLGYATLGNTDAANSPNLLQSGGTFTLATRLGESGTYLVGLSTDYRMGSQYSTIDTAAGNFAGTRFIPVAPMVGLRFMRFILKAEYELMGDYNLTNRTSAGASLSYTKPSGFRVSALVRSGLFRRVFVGPFYESVFYSVSSNSQQGQATLSPGFRIWQTGLTASVVF